MAFGRRSERATDPTGLDVHIVSFDPTIVGQDGEKLSSREYLDEVYARRLGSVVHIPNEGLGGPNLHLSPKELIAFEAGLVPSAEAVYDRSQTLPDELRAHFGLSR